MIAGLEVENFSGSLTGAICGAYGSSYDTIQNCSIHDNTNNYCINLINSGHNRIINCHLYNSKAGMFVENGCPYNQILGCEFYGNDGHSIYLDGGSASVANNIVSGCSFHDQLNGAGLQIKCQNNSIYNNVFYNFTGSGAPAFSIYSEYSPSYANDNDIFNNTFTNVVEAMWLGHNPANYPTLRNRIHDNTFTRVTNCIRLNPWEGAVNTVEDTWIYYNDFHSCTNPFPGTGGSASLIKNTVIAYNTFDATVPNAEVVALESYVNTMIYGNTPWMPDFNVPSPLPIPPR
jgi:parallel beta-helix repeat protein